MKHFLFLVYYYPPCNGIPARRPESWVKEWSKDHKVTIVTRHWTGEEKTWTDYLSSTIEKTETIKRPEPNIDIHHLPIVDPYFPKNKIIRKAYILLNHFKGNYSLEINTKSFYQYTSNLLTINNYDAIISSAPPLNLVKISSKLSKKHQTPWISDFRDFENHITLNPNVKLNILERILFNYKLRKIKKYNSQANLTFAINNEFISVLNHNEGLMIENGYDPILRDKVPQTKNSRLTISVIGTIYPEQNLNILFDAIDMLGSDLSFFQFNFIGTATNKDVAAKIKKRILKENLNITEKIPREKAIAIAKKSDILFHPAWAGYKGIYSGKIFEYLAFSKNIILSPGDGDVLDDLIKSTNSGVVINDSEKLHHQLQTYLATWKKNGVLPLNQNIDKVNYYSQERLSRIALEKTIQSIEAKND